MFIYSIYSIYDNTVSIIISYHIIFTTQLLNTSSMCCKRQAETLRCGEPKPWCWWHLGTLTEWSPGIPTLGSAGNCMGDGSSNGWDFSGWVFLEGKILVVEILHQSSTATAWQCDTPGPRPQVRLAPLTITVRPLPGGAMLVAFL